MASCYDDFELIACLSNRLDLSKGLEGASLRPSIVCQVMMQICRCKIDDPSKSISRVSVLDGCVQSPQAYSLCADLDVRAQWVSNRLLTPGSSFGVPLQPARNSPYNRTENSELSWNSQAIHSAFSSIFEGGLGLGVYPVVWLPQLGSGLGIPYSPSGIRGQDQSTTYRGGTQTAFWRSSREMSR